MAEEGTTTGEALTRIDGSLVLLVGAVAAGPSRGAGGVTVQLVARRACLERLLDGWAPDDLDAFASLLARFAAAVAVVSLDPAQHLDPAQP